MTSRKKYTGFAIALAWPQTYCKQPGSWYDSITSSLGISENNYYRAGHAALVLIDAENNKIHYFDFGRYHAPFQHGRVRSAETDHDLVLKTIPLLSIDGNTIQNFKDILIELQQNPSYHGEGELYASYCNIDFQAAYVKAVKMQLESPIPYGPFVLNGSNCSRFVNTVILAGLPKWRFRIWLKYFIPFTPTPINNVNSLQHKQVLPVMRQTELFYPIKRLSRSELRSTLPQPERHPDIPLDAQWLGGEGAGSWFVIEFQNKQLKVTRYAIDGSVECSGMYEQSHGPLFNWDDSFKIDYQSNCKEVLITAGTKELHYFRQT